MNFTRHWVGGQLRRVSIEPPAPTVEFIINIDLVILNPYQPIHQIQSPAQDREKLCQQCRVQRLQPRQHLVSDVFRILHSYFYSTYNRVGIHSSAVVIARSKEPLVKDFHKFPTKDQTNLIYVGINASVNIVCNPLLTEDWALRLTCFLLSKFPITSSVPVSPKLKYFSNLIELKYTEYWIHTSKHLCWCLFCHQCSLNRYPSLHSLLVVWVHIPEQSKTWSRSRRLRQQGFLL